MSDRAAPTTLPTRPGGRQRRGGYTLFEVLLYLVLVPLLAGWAVMTTVGLGGSHVAFLTCWWVEAAAVLAGLCVGLRLHRTDQRANGGVSITASVAVGVAVSGTVASLLLRALGHQVGAWPLLGQLVAAMVTVPAMWAVTRLLARVLGDDRPADPQMAVACSDLTRPLQSVVAELRTLRAGRPDAVSARDAQKADLALRNASTVISRLPRLTGAKQASFARVAGRTLTGSSAQLRGLRGGDPEIDAALGTLADQVDTIRGALLELTGN